MSCMMRGETTILLVMLLVMLAAAAIDCPLLGLIAWNVWGPP